MPLPLIEPPPVVCPVIWLKISCGPEKRAWLARLSMTMPVTGAFEPARSASCSEPRMTGLVQPAADVRADRDRPGQVEDLAARSGATRCRPARRSEAARTTAHSAARSTSGPPPIGAKRAWARPTICAVARRDRAHGGLVAVDDRGDADVDRLRGEDQPGAAETADLEVERCRCDCPSTHNRRGRWPSRRGRARARRGRALRAAWPASCAWTSGREPLRPETIALPPAKLRLVGASAQPSPERVRTAA